MSLHGSGFRSLQRSFGSTGPMRWVPTHAQDDDFALKVTALEQPVNVYLLTHSVLAIPVHPICTRAIRSQSIDIKRIAN